MKKLKLLSLFIAFALLLSACSSSSGGSKKKTAEKVDTSLFPQTVKNDKEIIEDGTLNYGLVTDTPFEGTLDYAFYQGAYDAEILQFFSEPLFSYNADHEMTNDGPATFELSDDWKTITIKISDKLKWHDGQPVTAEDYEYSFLVIGHPDYKGVRYDALMENIVGMAEYHAGKADKISGIEVLDEHTLRIQFKQANPSLLTGLWPYAMPKHYLGDVPVKDLAKSDKIRTKPIGFGPFKVKNIVPGESVEFERFDDYWKGKPKLKTVIVKVVDPSVVLESLKKGEIDIASGFPTTTYPDAKNLKNVQFLGRIEDAYTYIGFKLGHWDAKKNEAVMDNPKFQDVRLRQAIAYAIDNKTVAERFYHGLREPATTLIPKFFKTWHNDKVKGYNYDPEKAKQLLDEAGYKDVDGDGFREDPNGKKFVINFASMSGGDVAEPLAKFYIQNWKDVGLNVQLTNGRLIEFNSFYDMIQKDDPNIDIYQAAWGTGTDVDPWGLYSKKAPFNFSRFVDEENERLLEEGHSEKALDKEYRKKIYDEWQEYMHEKVPVIPTLFRYELWPVNNRVKNFTIEWGKNSFMWSDVGVTSDKPEVAK